MVKLPPRIDAAQKEEARVPPRTARVGDRLLDCATSGAGGIDLLRIHAQILQSFLRLASVKLAVASQARECRRRDRLRVDFEVTPQVLAVVAAPKAVGAECNQTPREPGRELVGHDLHVIGGRYNRPFSAL